MPASAATADSATDPVRRLLDHYRATARALPWRSPPGQPRMDAYRVWLSEVMLQQTTVATVTPRFTRFLERWPTIDALAAAPDADVLAEWAGLGYYARARNLIACARAVAARGGFPETETELKMLPGVGDYTAAAVAAIAFGADSTPIDTNVERVVARLEGLTDRKAIRAAAKELTPKGEAGDFAQALMDLGATICRPRNPACQSCPFHADCVAVASGDPEAFPRRATKKSRPHRHGIALWHERDGAIFLVRRPDRGMLGGMAALPGDDWAGESPPDDALARIRHVFSHFSLDLHILPARGAPHAEGWWQRLDRIDEVGLPTLYRKAVDAVRESR